MCDQLKDVSSSEWESLKADVHELKENQKIIMDERATLKGWLRGWLFGMSIFFVFAQAIGGIIVYRAMSMPEENRAMINEITGNLKSITEKMHDHSDDDGAHVSDKTLRQEYIPRAELSLTLSSLEQRNSQTRSDMERQFLEVKEQIIRLEAASAARNEKLDAKLDKLLDAKLK